MRLGKCNAHVINELIASVGSAQNGSDQVDGLMCMVHRFLICRHRKSPVALKGTIRSLALLKACGPSMPLMPLTHRR
jgi:hypothetical protein